MFLAFKEMRRAPARFGLLVVAIALLVFLILFQQTLQNGLLTSFVGAIEQQSAPVLVFSTDGRRSLQSSSITPELEQKVLAVPGVGRAGEIGQSTLSVRANDAITGAAVIGYQKVGLGSPRKIVAGRLPTSEGEGVANETDSDQGFGIGDVVRVQPGGYEITIVGQARDSNLQATPTIFTQYATWESAVRSANPDARDLQPNALALAPAPGVSDEQLVRRVNAASPDVEALTRADAAAKAPGVSQVKSSFLVIFLLYGLVVPLVTGLFFLIITFQKASSLTLLRAIGAPGSRLVTSLVIQVAIVLGLGIALGTALYAPVVFQRIGSIPLRFESGAVALWAIVLLVLGLASSLVAGRGACSPSTRSRQPPARECRCEACAARDAPTAGTLRHRRRAAHTHRVVADAPGGIARRPDRALDRGDRSATRQGHRLLGNGGEVVPPESHHAGDARNGDRGPGRHQGRRARGTAGGRTCPGERSSRPRRRRGGRLPTATRRGSSCAGNRGGLRRPRPGARRRARGPDPARRPGPDAGEDRRHGRRSQLLGIGDDLDLPVDVAHRAEREQAECGRGTGRVPGTRRRWHEERE